ncbi:MAG: winged helix DNA-binding domain-containing protein [Ginsengibacter sp.]
MSEKDIANTRLISQQITYTTFSSAKEILEWMGAMQAQDFNMAKWAIGLRLKNATEQNIHSAIDSGEIFRTHLLRPTWHFVSREDIYWMTELTAPRILSSMKGRNIQLELSPEVFKKANKIIEKVLSGNKNLTRKELINELTKAKIETDNNRASHIFFQAELEGIICNGKMKDKQTTYALLNERMEKPMPIKKEEALYRLAFKYFQSHSPATLPDFFWWSGLSAADAKKALESIKNNFISEKINEQEYWFPHSFPVAKKMKEHAFLLPAFDEFLISYKDRSAAISAEHQSKAFSNNGIFWPTIVINGKVAGLWKREIKKDQISIETSFFDKKNNVNKELIKDASEKFATFLKKKQKS